MKLHRKFYERPTLKVAKDLLGKVLVRKFQGKRLSGVITEVEAYVGVDDPASHAFPGRTPRNVLMFGHAGHAYVYFVYGMYYCVNIVTEAVGFPAAILIRAVVPREGITTMKRLRFGGVAGPQAHLVDGPGKLCLALGIDKRLNGADLMGRELWVEDAGIVVRSRDVQTTPRIGISRGKDKDWRFVWKAPKV